MRTLLKEPPPSRELLLEGPAGTGKTTGVLEGDHRLCEMIPGLRVLWLRKVRSHLSETVLRTFEDFVLPPGHPLKSGMSRTHRKQYEYPNGSRIIIAGMNRPDAFRSGEFHLIRFFEATECTLNDFEMASARRGRDMVLTDGKVRAAYSDVDPDTIPRDQIGKPWSQVLCDTNPAEPGHWLNLRADGKRMARMSTTHKDNPAFWSVSDGDWTDLGREYVGETLESLTGVRRSRYLEGRWSAAEGAIWPEFNRAVHVVDTAPELVRYIGGIDWGYRGAGVIHLYGLCKRGDLYLIRERYHTEVDREEWRDICKNLDQEFGVSVWVADSEDPQSIDFFRRAGLSMRLAFKQKETGFSLVRSRLKQRRLFVLASCNENPDAELERRKRPNSLIQEIESYVYAAIKDGKPVKEDSDPKCVDHACDVLRYVVAYLDRGSGSAVEEKPVSALRYGPQTMGYWLGHNDEDEL